MLWGSLLLNFFKHCSAFIISFYQMTSTTDIQEAAVAGLATSWHQKSMEA